MKKKMGAGQTRHVWSGSGPIQTHSIEIDMTKAAPKTEPTKEPTLEERVKDLEVAVVAMAKAMGGIAEDVADPYAAAFLKFRERVKGQRGVLRQI